LTRDALDRNQEALVEIGALNADGIDLPIGVVASLKALGSTSATAQMDRDHCSVEVCPPALDANESVADPHHQVEPPVLGHRFQHRETQARAASGTTP
jgi:hypothetical protein